MKPILLILAMWLAVIPSMAERRMPQEQINTGEAILDTLLLRLNRADRKMRDEGIGRFRFEALIQGTSQCTQNNRISKLMSDILPFDWRKRPIEFEALCQASYQYPCDLQVLPVSVFSNSRRSRKALREVNQVFMPLTELTLMNDNGSDKSYVPPFSDDGLMQYNFYINAELQPVDSQMIVIHFVPRRKHHNLIEGNAWVEQSTAHIKSMDFMGLVDFGHLTDTLFFAQRAHIPILERSSMTLDYRYGHTLGSNHFECLYNPIQFTSKRELRQETPSYDLTDVYRTFSAQYLEMPEVEPETWDTAEADTLTQASIPKEVPHNRRWREAVERLPKQLLGRSYVNMFGSEVRINGPLNPASLGYDKRNGITLRERLRFTHTWDNHQILQIHPEIGYSFGYHQLRYRLTTQWTFNPARRGSLQLRAMNKASGFSSKFKESVDDRIQQLQKVYETDRVKPWKHEMSFDDLELYFMHHHESSLEGAYELSNGLMGYAGIFYNYRTPERHGSRAISQAQFDNLVKHHYADLNPFIRLEYTPRQYYYYQDGYKRYLASDWPTFTFECTQGIYGWFGSTSNYTRLELDVQQSLRFGGNRVIAYHVGTGAFFRQSEEYFINYHYFAHSQYPSTWEEKIGGSFTLLDSYWYCSSPAYLQAHVMYESPFLLLNKIPAISRYVIKERIYLSNLIADGKNSYTEFGYGMGNNYFNIGVFGSMIGLKMWEAGVKFTIEFDQHL